MIRNIGVVATVLVLFMAAACGSSGHDGILPADKMQVVMWDMMRADELAMDATARDTARNSMLSHAIGYYQQVFAVHDITKEEFYRSLAYYQEHPDQNKVLMDSVQAIGNRERDAQSKRDSIQQVKQQKLDSIRLSKEAAGLKKDSLPINKDSLQAKKEALLKQEALLQQHINLKRVDSSLLKNNMQRRSLPSSEWRKQPSNKEELKKSIQFTPAKKLR